MSHTTVYEMFRTKANNLGELHNGHGSGPAIWEHVSQKCTGEGFPHFDTDKFWILWKSDKLSMNERAVLLSTYDFAVVETEKLQAFGNACHEVHGVIIAETKWTWNHFKDIGDIALSLHAKHDHRCIGLGIGCTSISDPWECWNFEQGKAWGIYGEIKELGIDN